MERNNPTTQTRSEREINRVVHKIQKTLKPTKTQQPRHGLEPLQQKMFLQKKKNRCNNIEIIAIVYEKCCNKIWGNKFVLQKKFVAINLKYFNENFDVIIYLLLQ